jgi:hypothetical protein
MTSAFKKKAAIVGIGTALMLVQTIAIAADEERSGAGFWQWALSIPASVNPLLDTTGEKCMVGQRGDIWYLGGLFGAAGNVQRNCKVPEGTTLFFPIYNSVQIDTPNICGQGPSIPEKDLKAFAKAAVDSATNLSVTVDGKNIKPKRIKSPVFAAVLPADNLFVGPCTGQPGAVVADVYAPSVDEGFYAQVNGLKPGPHIIQFHSEDGGGFQQDVTYNLDVVAVPKH